MELLSLDATLQLCSRSEACKSHISQKAYGEDFYLPLGRYRIRFHQISSDFLGTNA